VKTNGLRWISKMLLTLPCIQMKNVWSTFLATRVAFLNANQYDADSVGAAGVGIALFDRAGFLGALSSGARKATENHH